jgi:hypothetical protein
MEEAIARAATQHHKKSDDNDGDYGNSNYNDY